MIVDYKELQKHEFLYQIEKIQVVIQKVPYDMTMATIRRKLESLETWWTTSLEDVTKKVQQVVRNAGPGIKIVADYSLTGIVPNRYNSGRMKLAVQFYLGPDNHYQFEVWIDFQVIYNELFPLPYIKDNDTSGLPTSFIKIYNDTYRDRRKLHFQSKYIYALLKNDWEISHHDYHIFDDQSYHLNIEFKLGTCRIQFDCYRMILQTEKFQMYDDCVQQNCNSPSESISLEKFIKDATAVAKGEANVYGIRTHYTDSNGRVHCSQMVGPTIAYKLEDFLKLVRELHGPREYNYLGLVDHANKEIMKCTSPDYDLLENWTSITEESK